MLLKITGLHNKIYISEPLNHFWRKVVPSNLGQISIFYDIVKSASIKESLKR